MNSLLNYESFLKELSSLRPPGEIRLGLDRVEELLDRCGNPHRNLRSIVVAGTNGKGSVVAMLSNILKIAGYKVGSYISPHLCDIRERIMIDGYWIDKDAFLRIGQKILAIAKSMSDIPTFYEIITAIAFSYFNESKVDVAVLEIGLGGRLDAVNVVHPLESVITTIDFDHENYLGNTIASIAREKAGIIKEGVTVIFGEEKEEAVNVVEEVSLAKRAKLYRKGRDFDFEIKRFSLEESLMDFKDSFNFLPDIKLGLKGIYQFLNSSVAIESAILLNSLGISVSEKSIRDGIRSARWRGRFDVFNYADKVVILDGAHNPHGMNALVSSLELLFKGKSVCFVFGAMRDKNYLKMLKELSRIASKVIFTSVGIGRALSVKELLSASQSLEEMSKIPIFGIESPLQAFNEALNSKEEVICLCGSLYLIGSILEGNLEIRGLNSAFQK